MATFAPSLEQLRRSVDAVLHSWLSERVEALPENRPLVEELLRVMQAGGKRLRPAFCYWGYRAAGGGHRESIVRAAASLELLHTFALVHDDIMDASDERRGKPTVHSLHGVPVAVLAGDLALVLADALFFDSGFDLQPKLRAFDAYSVMRQEVIAGQYLDVRATSHFVDEDEARRIAVLKSGRYSVAKPLVIGARLAEAPDDVVDALGRFGEPVGEAFQFRDDILGLFGSRATLGKPTDSDVREGKRNLLYARAMQTLRGDDLDFFAERWGAGESLSPPEVRRLIGLVESSGARAYVEAEMEALLERAWLALERVEMDEGARTALVELARVSVQRNT